MCDASGIGGGPPVVVDAVSFVTSDFGPVTAHCPVPLPTASHLLLVTARSMHSQSLWGKGKYKDRDFHLLKNAVPNVCVSALYAARRKAPSVCSLTQRKACGSSFWAKCALGPA